MQPAKSRNTTSVRVLGPGASFAQPSKYDIAPLAPPDRGSYGMDYPAYLKHYELYRSRIMSIKDSVKKDLEYAEVARLSGRTKEQVKQQIKPFDLPRAKGRLKETIRESKAKTKAEKALHKKPLTEAQRSAKAKRRNKRKARADRKMLEGFRKQAVVFAKASAAAAQVKLPSGSLVPTQWVTVPKPRLAVLRELYQDYSRGWVNPSVQFDPRKPPSWKAYKELVNRRDREKVQQAELDELYREIEEGSGRNA